MAQKKHSTFRGHLRSGITKSKGSVSKSAFFVPQGSVVQPLASEEEEEEEEEEELKEEKAAQVYTVSLGL